MYVCMRVYVICVYVCLLGDICNIDGFYFRTMECSKNILFTLLLLIHAHTHECSLYIHSLQKKPVIPAVCPSNGSSSVLIQYLHFFFKIQEKAQMYPGECEKMQSSFLPSVSAPSKASKEP